MEHTIEPGYSPTEQTAVWGPRSTMTIQEQHDSPTSAWPLRQSGTTPSLVPAVPSWSPASVAVRSNSIDAGRGGDAASSHASAQYTPDLPRQPSVTLPFSADGEATGQSDLSKSSMPLRWTPNSLAQTHNGWPDEVSDSSLLPWLGAFFKRLHPSVPVLSQITVYEDLLVGKHRTNSDNGAMILALCAMAMVQCVYTEEASQLDNRIFMARSWMHHSARMRSSWNFGQNPEISTILTSFYLFGCLFSDGHQLAAWHQLRLAVDMSCQIGLDQPDMYLTRDKDARDQRMRIYLALAITER